MVGTKILVIDDDPGICDVLKLYFEREGCEVLTAGDGVEGVASFRQNAPDLVLLDIMLPKMDGQQVLAEIRKESEKPVIMITAKGEVFDKVLGLEMGADDFVVKPFDLKELYARVKAVLRRYQSHIRENNSDVIRFENFEISQEKFELKLRGKRWTSPRRSCSCFTALPLTPTACSAASSCWSTCGISLSLVIRARSTYISSACVKSWRVFPTSGS